MISSPTATRSIGTSSNAPGFAMHRAGRAIAKRLKVTFDASDCKILQRGAAGIHDGDDHSGECLAERQRGYHRYERNRIDADSSRQNIANDND